MLTPSMGSRCFYPSLPVLMPLRVGAYSSIPLSSFPITTQVLSVLRCDYDAATGGAGTMHRIPTQRCYEGDHVNMLVGSVRAAWPKWPSWRGHIGPPRAL